MEGEKGDQFNFGGGGGGRLTRARALIRWPLTLEVQFQPRPLYEEFVTKKVPLEHSFLRVLRYFSFSDIPPMFYTHSFITDAIYPQPMTASLTSTLYKFTRILPSEQVE
jgi:hypothetical protein